MKLFFTHFVLLLAAFSAPGQAFEEVGKAVPYVQAHPTDTALYFDAVTTDTFMRVAPGQIYAMKGGYEETTTTYSDGRPEHTDNWFEVRWAGKIAAPELPEPPIAMLPRDLDGWLNAKSFRPRGVSYSPAAEDLSIYLPFYEASEMEGGDFFPLFEATEPAFSADAKRRYLNDKQFKLAFENGTERIFPTDSVLEKTPGDSKLQFSYLGHYPTLGLYLLEVTDGKSMRYEVLSRRDGSRAAVLESPWALPVASPDASQLAVTCGMPGRPIHYLMFYRKNGDGGLVEQFTVRLPFQKITGLNWADNQNLLVRVRQDNPVDAGAEAEERFYNLFFQF